MDLVDTSVAVKGMVATGMAAELKAVTLETTAVVLGTAAMVEEGTVAVMAAARPR